MRTFATLRTGEYDKEIPVHICLDRVASDESRLTGVDEDGCEYAIRGRLRCDTEHGTSFDGEVTEGPQVFKTRNCKVDIIDDTAVLHLTDPVAKACEALFARMGVLV